MTDLVARVTITAIAEVRDKDGNLISSEPIEGSYLATQEQVDALGGMTVEPAKGDPK